MTSTPCNRYRTFCMKCWDKIKDEILVNFTHFNLMVLISESRIIEGDSSALHCASLLRTISRH